MLSFTKSMGMWMVFGIACSVSAYANVTPPRVVTVVAPMFKSVGGLGLDDVTITSPSLKSQI